MLDCVGPLMLYLGLMKIKFDWLQIDNSVVESFGGQGRTCITSRVYPKIAIYKNAHLFVFNNGSEAITVDSLDVWSMKAPSVMNN